MKNSKLYPNFKGTKAEYARLHRWVGKNFATPAECDHCETQEAKQYDWASIEDRYTESREDWEYLCRSCHIKSDGRINQLNKGGGEKWAGWNHTEESKAKMKANHWSTKRAWIPRERNEHGHFV